jgi:hypothetical protein
MKKSTVLTTAVILAVTGTLIAAKSFAPATSAAPTQYRALAPVASAITADMRPIVPSPVIDPNGAIFVGTGDGAGGAWVKP